MGKFSYQVGDTTYKGDFNIYQARHGGIMLLMGKTAICLTQQQVNDLAIDCYGLAEFDIDAYKSFYENEKQALNISDVIGTSFDWDKFAETLSNEYGSSHLIDGGDENNHYDYWLMDVTVKDIVDFIKNYR
jgi:hypothetical protein